jgi:hypothetical protein
MSAATLTGTYTSADITSFDESASSVTYDAISEPPPETVLWYPRLANYIPTNVSISNVTNGVLTYSDTSIDLINADSNFEQYLTPNDSFSNKEVSVWQCINNVETNKKIYHGKTKNISLLGGVLKINVYDGFTKLENNAYMGDSLIEAVLSPSSTDYVTKPSSQGKPIRFIFGAASPYNLNVTYTVSPGYGSGETGVVSPEDLNEAEVSDYVVEPSTTSNREHILCRVSDEGIKTLNFGTTVRYDMDYAGSSFALYYLTGHNLEVGDFFALSGGSGQHAIVVHVGEFISAHDGLTYNVELIGYAITWPSNLATGAVSNNAPMLWIEADDTFHRIFPTTGFTWSDGATTGGNRTIKIDLTNNAERTQLLNFADIGRAYDPQKDKIRYLVRPAKKHTHAEALGGLIESAGLILDTDSFANADIDLSANVLFTIPFKGEDEYQPIQKYVEAITRSTLGYVKINPKFEVEYHLLEAPASTSVIDTSHYNGVSLNIDYGDIVSEISAQNKHAVSMYKGSFGTLDTSYILSTNTKAKYLHDIDKTENFEHVLESIADRINAIMAIRSNRRARYNFTTATVNLNSEIGDDILLTSDRIAGANGVTTKQLKITSLQIDGKTVEVEADDLEGL